MPQATQSDTTLKRPPTHYPVNQMPGEEKFQWLQEHNELVNNFILAAIAGLARWTLKPDVNFKKGALRFFGAVMLALTVGIVIRNSEWLHSINNFVVAFCALAGDRIIKVILDNAPDITRWMLVKMGAWAAGKKDDQEGEESNQESWTHDHQPPHQP